MRRARVVFSRAIGAIGVVLVFACVAVGVTVTGASRASEAEPPGLPSRAHPVNGVADVRAELASSLHFAPASGATAVPPDATVTVTAGIGRLSNVRVASSSGAVIPGTLSLTGDHWRSHGLLAYATAYRVSATVTGAMNVRVQSAMTFTTVAPAAGVGVTVFPSSGLSVGVGQPIVLRFSQSITDSAARASVFDHLSVTESRPVSGGWYWFSDRELHFRPKAFWPTGEKIAVGWDLTGWNAGGGVWGEDAGTRNFTIGARRVSYANLSTDVMTVTENGRTIATYPISGGKPTDPTMDGVHIVLDRSTVVRMNSATNGVPVNSPDGYDELVYFDVHISDTGEYVHAAPWSVGSQGHRNVSHGCINLSPANAQTFFNFSRVGDVVVVTGSPRPPVVGDHGVMDWNTSFSAFTPPRVPTVDVNHSLTRQ